MTGGSKAFCINRNINEIMTIFQSMKINHFDFGMTSIFHFLNTTWTQLDVKVLTEESTAISNF